MSSRMESGEYGTGVSGELRRFGKTTSGSGSLDSTGDDGHYARVAIPAQYPEVNEKRGRLESPLQRATLCWREAK